MSLPVKLPVHTENAISRKLIIGSLSHRSVKYCFASCIRQELTIFSSSESLVSNPPRSVDPGSGSLWTPVNLLSWTTIYVQGVAGDLHRLCWESLL